MFHFLQLPTGARTPSRTHVHGAASPVGVAFTDRFGGVTLGLLGELNLGRLDADSAANVAQNFALVAGAIGVDQFVGLDQVHGNTVLLADADNLDSLASAAPLGLAGGQAALPSADGVVTNQSGVALVIRVADCVPLLFADPDAGVVGAAHAGRAGWLSGVVPRTVEVMHQLGARHIQAWVGPHICGRCYEVPEAMADEIGHDFPHAISHTSWGTPSLDLAAGVAAQLHDAGVAKVTWRNECTREAEHLHSHRRLGPDAGRLAGLIWLA